jgi:uncharacterized protein YndB with AHSA1/START domain
MRVETDGQRIVLEIALPVLPERVWAALVSPEAVAAWWGDHVRLVAEPGGELRERWRDGSGREVVTAGTVQRCEPPRLLETSWADDDWPGETVVRFGLRAAAGGGCVLRLEHAGWENLPAERRRELIEAHAAGWGGHLRSLAAYLKRSATSRRRRRPPSRG